MRILRVGRLPLHLDRVGGNVTTKLATVVACLLYTSDAADERSSVDLGGRRIIKKKTNTDDCTRQSVEETYYTTQL